MLDKIRFFIDLYSTPENETFFCRKYMPNSGWLFGNIFLNIMKSRETKYKISNKYIFFLTLSKVKFDYKGGV